MKGINKIEIHDIFQRIKNKEKDAVEVLYKKYYNLVRNISFSIVKDNDVAFIPVGGTYTMNSKEAANLINEIKPKKAIPIHYGSIVGTKQDATDFLNSLNLGIEGIILMK